MAAQGAISAVTDLDAGRAQAVAAQIIAAGDRASAAALDVTDDAALAEATATAAQTYGRLDALHSHAGVQIPVRWKM